MKGLIVSNALYYYITSSSVTLCVTWTMRVLSLSNCSFSYRTRESTASARHNSAPTSALHTTRAILFFSQLVVPFLAVMTFSPADNLVWASKMKPYSDITVSY